MSWWTQKRPMKPRRGTKVVWNDPIAKKASAQTAQPAYYKEAVALDPDIEKTFVPGKPVMALRDLCLSQDRGTYSFAPLELFYGSPGAQAPIPRGSLLVYAGEIRATERKRVNGEWTNVQVIKHTFITPCGRCIIHDFTLIGPV